MQRDVGDVIWQRVEPEGAPHSEEVRVYRRAPEWSRDVERGSRREREGAPKEIGRIRVAGRLKPDKVIQREEISKDRPVEGKRNEKEKETG